MLRAITIIAAGLIAIAGSPAFADSHVENIKKALPQIVSMIVQDDLIEALRASNAKRSNMTQSDIDKLEAVWQTEIDASSRPLIDSVVENTLAARMRKVINGNGNVINEIGVIDAMGLSIAQSSPNSDIWQGEEVKFTKTFQVGPDAVFVDEVEFDSSTQAMQSQANFTVKDPVTGKAIGAVTVGINIDAL
ncbi:MAG: hypothetical protein OEN55_01935 [Alphaproteobacteria bacterium]|nr:hypothetical protein [Alphaproteobacteria bacterium]